MEDLINQKLERFFKENLCTKLFCDFNFTCKIKYYFLFVYIRNTKEQQNVEKVR